jgi:nitrite reductase/ring-hydroxylating ferredoxin subunit
MAKLLKIAKTKDVPPGQAAAFTIEGQKIALFNVEGTYYAIGDTCTHRGGPLSEGDVQGTRVTCPWHGAHFDLKTSAVLGATFDLQQDLIFGQPTRLQYQIAGDSRGSQRREAELRTAASTKAKPLTPSSTVGNARST